MAFYFQLFWLPTGISAGLLLVLWMQDSVNGRAVTVFLSWFLLAGLLQYFGPFASAWALGLALQTVLAIVLLVKRQLEGL